MAKITWSLSLYVFVEGLALHTLEPVLSGGTQTGLGP
jgi:hypothetical protein